MTPLPPGWYHDPLGGPAARYWDGNQWDGTPPIVSPAEELPPESKRPSAMKPALIGTAVGLGVAVFVVAGIALWPKAETPPSPVATAPQSQGLATMLAPPPTTSTIVPAPAVADIVKKGMQQKFDTDPDLAELGLTVLSLTLVHKAGNEYKGYADIRAGNGNVQDVPVEVTADPDNILWQLPPGWTAFATPATTVPSRTFPVPGADAFGFLNGPRCSMLDTAALVVRTEQSGVVICRRDAPDSYFYNGLRLSDGGQITLDAQSVKDGYSATNPADGTRYVVTRNGLTIYTPDGEVYTEPAIAAGP